MVGANKIVVAIIVVAFIVGAFLYAALIQKPASQSSSVVQSEPFKAHEVASAPQTAVCGASQNTVVTKVIDGDTVIVEGGYHVRLLGIDADEKDYPCYDPAKRRLEELVLSKNVSLQKDVTDVDVYGRCLRTIFLGSQNIDLQLVKEGLAVARFYEPDVQYKQQIAAAEKQAVSNKVGCKWSR